MKKYIILLTVFCLAFGMCACGDNHETTTDPAANSATEQTETVTDVSENANQPTEAVTDPTDVVTTVGNEQMPTDRTDSVTQNTDELFENATIPDVESYTMVADAVKPKDNFVFKGEKKPTKTCNKIISSNADGITQTSFAFAEDGSKIRVLMEDANGTRTQSIIGFNENGEISDITNGSGSFSNYFYKDRQIELLAYDASGNLFDKRTYYTNEKDQVERVECVNGEGAVETYVYTAGDNGLTRSLRVENSTGYILYEYTYDENNNLICTRIEQNNKFYVKQLYTYNERGDRTSYTIRNLDEGVHALDATVLYNNVYAPDGTYLGTAEVDSESGEVYIAVAYDYIETQYPHYADFIKAHYATY